MRIYLAGCSYQPWEKLNFYNFYRLDSYLAARSLKSFVPSRFKDFILDSGIFSYLNGKDATSVDWEQYVHNYAEFVKFHKIRNYVEIDIDRFYGLDVVESLRAKLEKQVGWPCMPVWHMNRGYDKWLEICRDYKYVCFGAFLTDHLKEKNFPKVARFIRDARKQGCKVHGLGFTCQKWLDKLHFYSVDSSSWTAGVRYGGTFFKFTGRSVEALQKPAGSKILDMKKLAFHSFKEWVKFSRYADRHL